MTISEGILREFIDGLKQSAAAQERAAATSEKIAAAVEQSTLASERRQEAIINSLAVADRHREDAVKALGEGILELDNKATVREEAREKWWRIGWTMLSVALVLGAILGVPVGRIVSALLGIKP